MTNPQPMVTIEFVWFRKNERWFGYRFKVPRWPHWGELQTSGQTSREAEEKMHKQLLSVYPARNYIIKEVGREDEYVRENTFMQDAPTK